MCVGQPTYITLLVWHGSQCSILPEAWTNHPGLYNFENVTFRVMGDNLQHFLWSSKSFTLPQPTNHLFIKINLLRVISKEISHACRSLCWQTNNTALDCGYYRLIVKLLANFVSQLTCRMLLACSLAAHKISSASPTSVLPQHPQWEIVPYRVDWTHHTIDYPGSVCLLIDTWLYMILLNTNVYLIFNF